MKKKSIFSAFRFISLALGVILFLLVYVSSCAPQPRNGIENQQSFEEVQSGRSVKHAMGETIVPEQPQRVVILTNEGTDMLLALGVMPIGAVQSWQGDPYYDYLGDQLDDVPTVGDELKPNIESIVALQPDLIIGSKIRQKGIYKKLKAIAPTIFSETIGSTWKENLKLYAEAVNREDEATSLMLAWDKRIEEFKQKLGNNPPTVSLVRFLPGTTRVYFSQSFPGKLVKEAGLDRPNAQEVQDFAKEINIESINILDADYLFYFTFDNEENNGDEMKNQWLKHPLWQKLRVVQKGNAYAVSDSEWTSSGGIMSANLVLDDLSKYILSKESLD
ncbi:periplasmic binding protein [[Leptolyngbya] sp. PCC 7376]|uniref:ABC transporter substrate-binding protein n=1 Tax=[Leptolyngbya] sp. PCC 7376 TaxID=111781 RepID=UPI00029EF580|nr:iron-siderophore ABC transporter substrate-binding protein [[Leptolyngbya] sp. PCC 7376]AFY40270.1 periplasmic binding protein [[Leptolyngbya] sp. PCC 7376]